MSLTNNNNSDDCSRRRRQAKACAKSFIKREPIKFQVAQEFGFSMDIICKIVYKHYLDGDGEDYVCAGDLIMDLLDFEEGKLEVNDDEEEEEGACSRAVQLSPAAFESLQSETLENWKRVRCVTCTSNKCVLFLPCTHLLFCGNCANDCEICPVCDTNIENKLLVYIG